MNPINCKFNRRILCGIVKNPGHCPYVNEDRCKENTITGLFGVLDNAEGKLTIQQIRYDLYKISFKVLDVGMCNECKVIWADLKTCPICEMNKGDE